MGPMVPTILLKSAGKERLVSAAQNAEGMAEISALFHTTFSGVKHFPV
jgi:hypothetical protein